MLNSRVAILGVALAGALSGMPAIGYQPPVVTVNASKKSRKGLFNGRVYSPMRFIGTKGAGITMAQQKRAARKTRNVRRHKAATRG